MNYSTGIQKKGVKISENQHSFELNGQSFIRHNLVETVSVQQLHSTLAYSSMTNSFTMKSGKA